MKNQITKFVWSKPTLKTVYLDSRIKDPKKLIKAVNKEVYCVDTDRLYTVVIDGKEVFKSSNSWFLNELFFSICKRHYDEVIEFYNENYNEATSDDRDFIIKLFEFVLSKYENEFELIFIEKIKHSLYFSKLENGGFNSIKTFIDELKFKALLKIVNETIKLKGSYLLTYYGNLGFYVKIDFEFSKDTINMYVNDVLTQDLSYQDPYYLERTLRDIVIAKKFM